MLGYKRVVNYYEQMLLELKQAGYLPNKKIYLDRVRNYDMRRWYDNNKYLFLAFEYLKDAEQEVQKEVSGNILQYIRQESAASLTYTSPSLRALTAAWVLSSTNNF